MEKVFPDEVLKSEDSENYNDKRQDSRLEVDIKFVVSGERRKIWLQSGATAHDVRETLGLTTDPQLLFSGIQLEDDCTLEDHGVVPQSTIMVVHSITAGDNGTGEPEKLSQLPLDASLHGFGKVRNIIATYWNACWYPKVPESSKLWWWPKIKRFSQLRQGSRVQVDENKLGLQRWVDARVVTSATAEDDRVSSEDDEWTTTAAVTGSCTVEFLAGELRGQQGVITDLKRIRGTPRPGSGLVGVQLNQGARGRLG